MLTSIKILWACFGLATLFVLAGCSPTTGLTNNTPAVTPVPIIPVTATRDPDYAPPTSPWRPVPLPTASPTERKSAGDSWLYLAAFQSDFVSVVDPISGHAMRQVPVIGDQAGQAVSPDGARLYIVDELPSGDGQLRVFDTLTWQVVHQEPLAERLLLLGGNPITLSPDGRWLVVGYFSYQGNEGWNRVFDTARLEFVEGHWELSDCGQTPLRLHGQPDDSRLYVQCPGFVAELRAEDLSLLRQIPSPTPFEGGGPGSPQVGGPDLAVSRDGQRLYGLYPKIESSIETNRVQVVGTDLQLLVWETGKGKKIQEVIMSQQVPVPLATVGRGDTGYLTMSHDGERIFMAWEDMLWVLDKERLRVIKELRLTTPVDGMVLSVDGRELYLLPSTSSDLDVRKQGMFTVDASSLELVRHADDWPRLIFPFFFAAPAPRQP